MALGRVAVVLAVVLLFGLGVLVGRDLLAPSPVPVATTSTSNGSEGATSTSSLPTVRPVTGRGPEIAAPSPRTTTTTQNHVVPEPENGIYTNGYRGSSHYFVVVASKAKGTLSGSVDFVDLQGQTSVVFTFSGTWQSNLATLHPKRIPRKGPAAQKPATVPTAISMPYDQVSLHLGECMLYLRLVQSAAQCSFSYSPSGSLDK